MPSSSLLLEDELVSRGLVNRPEMELGASVVAAAMSSTSTSSRKPSSSSSPLVKDERWSLTGDEAGELSLRNREKAE